MKARFLLFCLLIASPLFATTLINARYIACFTPGQNCTQNIVNVINSAHQSVLVQSYSFTSLPIEEALINAHSRGIDVRVIFDKSQLKQRSSLAKYVAAAGIPCWVDYRVAIAHNKVIIVDGETVATGSFNFTHAAQFRNAENSLIIRDAGLAKAYAQNWVSRERVARRLG